jgi:CRISPR-associated endonuclease Csn1
MWGLNAIINHENNEKNREDHRHHAIDAVVMSCFKRQYIQQLTKWNRYRDREEELEFPMPWDSFFEDAKRSIDHILVSHKANRRVLTTRHYKVKKDGKEYRNKGTAARGFLHKEFVYGKRTKEGKEAYHIRKPLESLKTATHVEKIVDPVIQKLILNRIESLGGYEKGKNIPKGAFFEGETPMIVLPNKNGAPVPVRKVRMKENIGNAEALKEGRNQYVNPRNNHHILIYRNYDDELKEQIVTFWTAVERKAQKQPIFQLPEDGKEMIATLQENDMFLLGLPHAEIDFKNQDLLSKHLYRVQKLSSSYYTFRHHLASTLTHQDQEARITSFKAWKKENALKVKIDFKGKVVEK